MQRKQINRKLIEHARSHCLIGVSRCMYVPTVEKRYRPLFFFLTFIATEANNVPRQLYDKTHKIRSILISSTNCLSKWVLFSLSFCV